MVSSDSFLTADGLALKSVSHILEFDRTPSSRVSFYRLVKLVKLQLPELALWLSMGQSCLSEMLQVPGQRGRDKMLVPRMALAGETADLWKREPNESPRGMGERLRVPGLILSVSWLLLSSSYRDHSTGSDLNFQV